MSPSQPRRCHAHAVCTPDIVASAVAHEEHPRGVCAHTGRRGPKDGGVGFAAAKLRRNEDAGGHPIQTEEGLIHTFDDEGADVVQSCCEWRDNRLVGRPKAGLKGSLTSSNLRGMRSHYR